MRSLPWAASQYASRSQNRTPWQRPPKPRAPRRTNAQQRLRRRFSPSSPGTEPASRWRRRAARGRVWHVTRTSRAETLHAKGPGAHGGAPAPERWSRRRSQERIRPRRPAAPTRSRSCKSMTAPNPRRRRAPRTRRRTIPSHPARNALRRRQTDEIPRAEERCMEQARDAGPQLPRAPRSGPAARRAPNNTAPLGAPRRRRNSPRGAAADPRRATAVAARPDALQARTGKASLEYTSRSTLNVTRTPAHS